jgi:hypothetical protein
MYEEKIKAETLKKEEIDKVLKGFPLFESDMSETPSGKE